MSARVTKGEKTLSKLRDDLRDVFGLYDLQMMYDDDDSDNPIEFISVMAGGEMYIRLQPFNWSPKRDKKDRTLEYAIEKRALARKQAREANESGQVNEAAKS